MNSKNIAVLDYGLGNVRSVSNALNSLGAKAQITNEKNVIFESNGLIIPGVGAFPHAMANLFEYGLIDIIQSYIQFNKPVLGICLGMQLLFDEGYEFEKTAGLGLITGEIKKIPILPTEGRLPHISWSQISPSDFAKQTMFSGLSLNEMRFYFVHSYAATNVSNEHLSATTKYLNKNIVAAVQRDNIWGTQFHPEKSGPSGLKLIKNFIDKC